ncbi:AraC family transcriptional regulator [Marivirga tractuosa]
MRGRYSILCCFHFSNFRIQHFSNLFKTKTGMSPSEYRNLN